MSTILCALIFLGYVFGAFFLLVSSIIGYVNTKKLRGLSFALALFVLLPLSVLWAKVIIPLVGLTVLGYGIVLLGMWIRSQLILWKDRLIEEIKNNLTLGGQEND